MTFKSPITPYLIRASYDWIVDTNLVPYIEIDTTCPGITIPTQFYSEKTIVLNVAPQAVNKLKIDNQVIEFEARFGNHVNHIHIPMSAVIAIYARENGFGMQFIPHIEYLGEDIEFTEVISIHKPLSIDKSPKKPGASSKSKLKLITKETFKDNSDPAKKS